MTRSTASDGLTSRFASWSGTPPPASDSREASGMELPEHARINQAAWNVSAADYVGPAQRNWAAEEISWGIWNVPEAQVQALPDVDGLDVVELGCGTAYFCAWLARRGARPVGVDLSENQLATARALQAEHGLEFPLIHASAEDVPLPDDSRRPRRQRVRRVAVVRSGRLDRRGRPAAAARRPAGLPDQLAADGALRAGRGTGDRPPAARSARAEGRDLSDERPGRRVPPLSRRLDRDARPARVRRRGAARALRARRTPTQTSTSGSTPEWAHRWPVEEIWAARRVLILGVGDAGEILTLQRAAYVGEAMLYDQFLPPLHETLDEVRDASRGRRDHGARHPRRRPPDRRRRGIKERRRDRAPRRSRPTASTRGSAARCCGRPSNAAGRGCSPATAARATCACTAARVRRDARVDVPGHALVYLKRPEA